MGAELVPRAEVHVAPILDEEGWCTVPTAAKTPEALAAGVEQIALSLGKIAPGRGYQLVERIVPEEPGTARAGSLSSKYGLAPLPLHTDTAHWITPCRYLVMGCV